MRHEALARNDRTVNRRLAPVLALIVVALVVAACGGTQPPEEPNLFLLLTNYSQQRIEVLSALDDPAELARDASAAFDLDASASPTSVLWGPGNRIYVVDHGVGRILVYDADTALDESSPSPVAVITSADLEEPIALAFDAAGSLWVTDGRRSSVGDEVANSILRFDAVASTVGNSVLTPDAVIELHADTLEVFAHNRLTTLYFDHLGRLWFTDYYSWTVFRFDDPDSFSGTTVDVIPELQFRSLDVDPNLSPIRNPAAVALTTGGVLYVGSDGQNTVARFDDLSEIDSGTSYNAPSANLSVGLPRTSILALDPDGDLWVGSAGDGTTSEIVRVENAGSGSGAVTLTPAQRVAWAVGSQYTYGGSAIFHER